MSNLSEILLKEALAKLSRIEGLFIPEDTEVNYYRKKALLNQQRRAKRKLKK
jgi:hypothetical protein